MKQICEATKHRTIKPTHELRLVGPNSDGKWLAVEYLETQSADENGYLWKTRQTWNRYIGVLDGWVYLFEVRPGQGKNAQDARATVRPLPGLKPNANPKA